MAYSDPYEDWKAQGRPGGDFNSWKTSQLPPPPAPAPAAKPVAAPAPAAAPAPTPSVAVPPPAPAAPAVPEHQLNASFRAQAANSDWRDQDSGMYSPQQWDIWENQERERYAAGKSANQNGQCPPNKPFTGRGGQCAEKPDDCPDGSHVEGSDTNGTARCVPDGARGGGAGGGGGAVAGGGGGGLSGRGLDEMTEYWKNLTKQSGSRYTPEVMAALEADQFSRARAQEKQQLEMARQDQAQRGVARSANQSAATRQIGVGTGQQIMANRAQIQKSKIDADFQDKQAAIQNAQNWVNSMRDYLLRGDANAIQREQIGAQIRLAQMNIEAQKSMLEQQYQNNLSTNLLLNKVG